MKLRQIKKLWKYNNDVSRLKGKRLSLVLKHFSKISEYERWNKYDSIRIGRE